MSALREYATSLATPEDQDAVSGECEKNSKVGDTPTYLVHVADFNPQSLHDTRHLKGFAAGKADKVRKS